MTADKPSHLVPKLRFPEFRDAAEWDLMPLSSVSNVNPSSDGLPELFIYIDLESVNSSMLIERKEISRDAAPSRAQRLLSRKDIIYQTVRPYQRNNFFFDINDGCEYVASTGYAQLRAHGSPEFLYQLLHTGSFVSSVLARCTGSNYPAINPSALASIDVALPRKTEQQKIADCLGSLDNLIAAEGRKLEVLRQHKQGLMQQILPQFGETVPRLRFPEFQNAGAWEEEKLDDLARRGTGHTPKKAIAEYYNGGIKWVSLADSKRLDNGLISETEIEISEKGIDNSSAVLHPTGSVILSRDAGVGKSAIIGCSMAVSQHFIVWTCEPTVLSNWFLYYQLQLLKPLFERIATGSTIKTIGLPFFNAMRVTIPRLAEQHRIADCLSTLDARLAAQVQNLNVLKTYKQGLLQQLFPSLERQ